MLDLVFGESRNLPAVDSIVKALTTLKLHGTLYIGYPILNSIEGTLQIDALLTCLEHAIVAFNFSTSVSIPPAPSQISDIEEKHNDIYINLSNKLLEYKPLRKGRKLPFEINVVTIVPTYSGKMNLNGIYIASPAQLSNLLEKFSPITADIHSELNAVIQRTTTIKPRKKRTHVKKAGSSGNVLKIIEKEIANLDAWQKKASIEYPEGPQRIRGLAGSGKTIVLAQKASFLHAKYPEWRIAVTFQTRSLYQQFRNLIRRFSFELIRDEPDWTKLKVIHAWGSPTSAGVYSEIASSAGIRSRDFAYGKSHYGSTRAFDGVCSELLQNINSQNVTELYDVVLIDEAQDFPKAFFELVYLFTATPKRIVWAYDELQNLSDYSMPPAEELFGNDSSGNPRVRLRNTPDQPQQDIVLPICYRNTPWALTIAHGLGFGIYRTNGLVQMFDSPSLWLHIGYEIRSGDLTQGHTVSLARGANAAPKYFYDLLSPDDAVNVKVFENSEDEYSWVSEQIEKNLKNDELDPDDILIIIAHSTGIQNIGSKMMRALQARNLESHLVGITASRDILFYENSIAITSIFRAKGNEAPMVYVIAADHCFEGFELSRKRNILFTAITRSRAWVRITGVGSAMESLAREIESVINNTFELKFIYPSDEQIQHLRRIHRDMSQDEKLALEQDIQALIRLKERIDKGDIALSSLPADLQALISQLFRNR